MYPKPPAKDDTIHNELGLPRESLIRKMHYRCAYLPSDGLSFQTALINVKKKKQKDTAGHCLLCFYYCIFFRSHMHLRVCAISSLSSCVQLTTLSLVFPTFTLTAMSRFLSFCQSFRPRIYIKTACGASAGKGTWSFPSPSHHESQFMPG